MSDEPQQVEGSQSPPTKLKSLTLFIVVLAVGLLGCGIVGNNARVKGSGVSKTEQRQTPVFDSLEVKCHGTIQVRAQGQAGLEISGDDNIVPLITAEVRGGTLYIQASKEYDARSGLRIAVSTSDLKRFVFAGAGEASLTDVKNDRLEIVMSGAGSLTASGETQAAEISLTGVGSMDAKGLRAVDARVSSTGAGSVDVYATGQLEARATGVGEINYYGNPKIVKRQATGIGSINER